MKSFKSLVNNIEEAMGGKRNENFTGDDEIGDFWVVTKADKISIPQGHLQESTGAGYSD